jgi:hypothetical protein
MSLTDDQIKAAAKILRDVVTSDQAKLQFGVSKRNEIRDAIRRGDKVTGYRVDWLRKTRDRVIETLQQAAKEFNETHKHDRISVTDLHDVLTTTQYAYEIASKKQVKGDD